MMPYGNSQKNRKPYKGKDRPGPVGEAHCTKCHHTASAPKLGRIKHCGCGGLWV